MLRRFLVAILLSLSSSFAHAGFYTDLWFNPAQPGYGFNFAQTDNFIFVTFFIYGANGQPTWYTATLNWDGASTYTGAVYANTGTFFGAPWNPANLHETQVGTATFTPSANNAYQAQFAYVVNGVGSSNVPIERQTLTPQVLAGNYAGGTSGFYSNCTNPDNNTSYTDFYYLSATQQTSNDVTLQFDFIGGLTCTLSGAIIHNGQLYRMPNAHYTCASGEMTLDTTASMSQIKQTSQGIEGQFFAPDVGGGCSETGFFSAVLN